MFAVLDVRGECFCKRLYKVGDIVVLSHADTIDQSCILDLWNLGRSTGRILWG